MRAALAPVTISPRRDGIHVGPDDDTAMCQTPTCLLAAAPGDHYCAVHAEAIVAHEAKAEGTCWRCRRKIRPEDFVSRTRRQDKHKTTGVTRFSWQHYACRPTVKQPSKATRRAAAKPLFVLLDPA